MGRGLGNCWRRGGLTQSLSLVLSAVFAPLLRLSPPPGDHDYIYNLDESEGVCDLFDVPVLNL